MNIAVTQCPACATRFNVSEAQLAARDGLVRCGRCEAVFNAAEHLLPDEPSPQLSLPIGDDDATPAPTDSLLAPLTGTAALDTAPSTLAQQVQFHDVDPEQDSAAAPVRHRAAAWLLGLLLLLLLIAQAAYFFRSNLALRLPALKPVLVQGCELLSCTIDLPHDADLLAIESSELEADAKQPNAFTLHVLLHNQAAHAQALPSLELTLTDTQDQVIARRIFSPVDYLQTQAEKPDALAAKRELALTLHLEIAELRPTGYRLFLFYPPQP